MLPQLSRWLLSVHPLPLKGWRRVLFWLRMRTIVYIDGYNLYHAIDSLSRARPGARAEDKHFLKWLDLQKLAHYYSGNGTDAIENIYYFSAYARHISQSKVARHRDYIRVLEQRGVQFIEGEFKWKGRKWVQDQQGNFIQKDAFEEKESDVNVAIHIVRDALLKRMDKALVITNDSDIAPAIRMAREHNPRLKVKIITPPLQLGAGVNHALLDAAGLVKRDGRGQTFRETKILNETILFHCQLPDRVLLADGNVIQRPGKYAVPSNYR